MAKKLKVYRTSIGFFDLAVAAPSMKAAAEAWGSDVDIFSRGFAEQTDDPRIVEATLAAPGVVLRRPVGSDGAFAEKAALPKASADDRPKQGHAKKEPHTKSDDKAKRDDAAALENKKKRRELEREQQRQALEKEQRRQELERLEKEAEEERARKRREQAMAKAEAAFERARARHDEAVTSISQRREELDKDEACEDDRWEREQQAHKDALKEAGS